jgi:hypothetical protein
MSDSSLIRHETHVMPLMAGDILIVPDSRGKRAATRALEAAVQAAITIGTYGIVQ